MGRVPKNQWKFPTKSRVLTLLRKLAAGYVLWIAAVGFVIYTTQIDVLLYPGLIMLGVLTLVVGWGSYWYWTRPSAKSTVLGVRIVQKDPEHYVPPSEIRPFLEEVVDALSIAIEAYREENPLDISQSAGLSAYDLISGVTIVSNHHKPRDPVSGEEKIGVTQPRMGHIDVWAPYLLSHGGAGYELRLVAMERLFPGRREGKDIAWMKEHGVI